MKKSNQNVVNNKVIKQCCHAKLDLESSTQAVYKQQQQALKILNQVQDDFIVKKPHGFTLIELLVVVLIIGILAAVAVPQYQKAVEKARLTEALTNVSSIEKVVDLYVLEHGYGDLCLFCGPTTKVDIDIKGGLDCPADGNYCLSKNYKYQGGCTPGSEEEELPMACKWLVLRDPNYILYGEKLPGNNSWVHYCEYNDEDAVATTICTQLYNQGWKQGDLYF